MMRSHAQQRSADHAEEGIEYVAIELAGSGGKRKER
jgi:hypothetical protein